MSHFFSTNPTFSLYSSRRIRLHEELHSRNFEIQVALKHSRHVVTSRTCLEFSCLHQNVREILFPRLTLCFADGGYQDESLRKFNFDGIKRFVCGESSGNKSGWTSENFSAKQIFEESYRKPKIEELFREDSFLKFDKTIRKRLEWIEKPMVYPEGRCLMLNLTKTNHLETTIILKFKNTSFAGNLELTITDPHREYYKPDIFSFSGERIIFDFSKGTYARFQKMNLSLCLLDFNTFIAYRIKLHQTEDLQEDSRAKCREYDGEESFRRCSRRALDENYQDKLGCSPPWFNNDYSTVCNRTLSRAEIDNIWEAAITSRTFQN